MSAYKIRTLTALETSVVFDEEVLRTQLFQIYHGTLFEFLSDSFGVLFFKRVFTGKVDLPFEQIYLCLHVRIMNFFKRQFVLCYILLFVDVEHFLGYFCLH